MPDRKEGVKDAEKTYGEPRRVLEDASLSTAEKIDVLESWKSDLLQLQRASDENMPGTDVQGGSTADRLKQVVEALDALQGGRGTGG